MPSGFESSCRTWIPELPGEVQLWRHERSGAQLLSIETEDPCEAFGVVLRTPPEDATGVPHILEHMALGGSRKVPIRSPLSTALRGSHVTYVNALTFPDKTSFVVPGVSPLMWIRGGYAVLKAPAAITEALVPLVFSLLLGGVLALAVPVLARAGARPPESGHRTSWRSMSLALGLAMIAFLLTTCSPACELPISGHHAFGMGTYDRTFARLMANWDVPGGALAVMRNGRLLLARGYGWADVTEKEPVTPESLFRIASVSKPVTAAATLKLVANGRLSLEAAAFPLLRGADPSLGPPVDPRYEEITVRDLLAHIGGWDATLSGDPMFESTKVAKTLATPGPAGCVDTIRYMLAQPLDHDPGTTYAYSNFGYCVLGRVIEAAAGRSYEEYVREAIIEPLNIASFHLGRTLPEERQPGEVRYYDFEGASLVDPVFPGLAGPVPSPYGGFCLEAMDAHGGWVASAPDVARFVAALDGSGPIQVLPPESAAAMVARPAPPVWEGQSDYYGLGWRVRPAGGDLTWWHTGSLPGTVAVVKRTASGLIWVAVFNTRPEAGDAFVVDIITSMGRASLVRTTLIIAPVAFATVATAIGLWHSRRRRVAASGRTFAASDLL